MPNKCFVLDTNVLLHDPRSLYAFEDNEVVIPLVVLDELDKVKQGHDEKAKHARMVIRSLDKMRNGGSIHQGVATPKGGIVRVELNHRDKCPPDLDPNRMDNRLISVALGLMKESDKHPRVSLITKDINLRVKCDALGVCAADYNADSVAESPSSIYEGTKTIWVSEEQINEFHANLLLDASDLGEFYPNQYVELVSNADPKHTGMARYQEGTLVKIRSFSNSVWGIYSRNREQAFALDALFDPNIKLVTLIGKAGSGKTLIAAAAGISQLLDSREYKKMVMTRPVQPMGRDLGFLPGPQPLDANILTPDGWKKMGSLSVGDFVIGRDGKKTKLLGIYPKGKKLVYGITTTDGTHTECCEDHLWHTKTAEDKKRGRDGSVKDTKTIINSLTNNSGKINHFLPRNEVVEYTKNKLPLPPYTLGAILGDGCISDSISLSNTDLELIQRVEGELKPLECRLTRTANTISYSITGNIGPNKVPKLVKITNLNTNEIKVFDSICQAEKQIGVNKTTINSRCVRESVVDNNKYEFVSSDNRWSNKVKDRLYSIGLGKKHNAYNKFIPDLYKYSSIDDRLDLLRGLMDADGTVKNNGEALFCTTSYNLAKDVVEIVRSLGGRAVVRERDRVGKCSYTGNRAIETKRISYEFTISLPEKFNPFYISRKASKFKCKYIHMMGIKSIEEIGIKEVQCILVENPEHLYITDDFIVTHNTLDEKMQPWMAPLRDNLELLFSDKGSNYLEMQKDSGAIEVEALTYIRGRSIPRSFIIVDEAQNLSSHEIKTIITRVGEGSKVILTGDILQIDNPFIDSVDNGLSCVIEKFKDHPVAAHVTLQKGERSSLATLAAEIL